MSAHRHAYGEAGRCIVCLSPRPNAVWPCEIIDGPGAGDLYCRTHHVRSTINGCCRNRPQKVDTATN